MAPSVGVSEVVISFSGGPVRLWVNTSHVASDPPKGYYKVTNLYVDPNTGRLVVEYDETPTP